MKRNILYIVFGIIALIIVIRMIVGGGEYGSKAEIQVPSESVEGASVRNVTFIVDNSGSMRGYVDFSGNRPGFGDAKKTFISKVGDFMSNCTNVLGVKNTVAKCNGKEYKSTDDMLDALSNYSAFSGPITELAELVGKAMTEVNDSSISIVVSDMILSYGKATIKSKGDDDYNKHALDELKAKLKNKFQELKNSKKEILLIKYVGDFNGKYYYNYTENLKPNKYNDTLMINRPFYFMVIGGKENLKALCDKNCVPKGYETIFSTMSLGEKDLIPKEFTVSQPEKQPQWILGNPNPKDEKAKDRIYTISMSNNLKTTQSDFTFTFDELRIPIYAGADFKYDFDKKVLSEVQLNESRNAIIVKTKPYDQFGKEEKLEVKIYTPLYVDPEESSTLDDVEATLENLENKTWGFKAIVEAIYEAYDINKNEVNTIANLKVKIQKK